MLAVSLTKKLKCLYLFGKWKSFFLSPLNFPGQPMITQSIESHSSTFSHRSWGDNLQCQESTEVWPSQLLNDGEAQNYLPSAWGNGSEQTERSWESTDIIAQEAPPVLTSYFSLAQSSQCSLLGNSLLRWRNLFLMANWGETDLCLMALPIFKLQTGLSWEMMLLASCL